MPEAISLNDLVIGYRNRNQTSEIAKIPALHLNQGKLTCLLGANGIGKSTLIKTITGALPSLAGDILVNGHNLASLSIIDRAKQLATVLTEKPNLGYTTVYEMVALGRNPHTNWQNKLSINDDSIVHDALRAIRMLEMANQPLAELSDGNLQKVIIGRALAQETDIIVLDEPTVHLDVSNKTSIIKLLRSLCVEHGKTVLFSTHDLELAFKYADYLWLFDTNHIRAGLSEDLIINGEIEKIFPATSDVISKNLKIKVTGPENLTVMVTSALLKADITDHNKIREINIVDTNSKIVYKAADAVYHSLDELIKNLNSI
jgi:iron complex transport system ATP-binding protein